MNEGSTVDIRKQRTQWRAMPERTLYAVDGACGAESLRLYAGLGITPLFSAPEMRLPPYKGTRELRLKWDIMCGDQLEYNRNLI